MLNILMIFFAWTVHADSKVTVPERRDFPVNTQISPCEDMFAYACSKTIESFKLRPDRSSHNFAFTDSADRILEKRKVYLKEWAADTTLTGRKRQIADFFAACMDPEAGSKDETLLSQRTMQIVKEKTTRDEWLQFFADNLLASHYSVLAFDDAPNQANPDRKDIYFESQVLSLPEPSYYKKADLMKDYEVLIKELFKTMKMDKPEERAKSVLEFESKLAESYPNRAELQKRYYQYSGIKREELLKQFPHFKLQKFLEKVPKKVHIRNIMPEHFVALNQMLETVDLNTLQNVVIFREVFPLLDDSNPSFYDKKFRFNQKHLGGPEKRPDRLERCSKLVGSKLGKEFDAETIDLMFPGFPKDRVVKMVGHVREAILDGLKANKWLSPGAKKEAQKKIKLATLQLVRPDNDKQWDFNPELDYSRAQPLQNSQRLAEAMALRVLERIDKKRDRDIWYYGPLTVNAFYTSSDNRFVLLQGILQPPMYDPASSETINLGAIGAVIGHELGHAIDSNGSQYDQTGKLRQWMTAKDLENFRARTQRLTEQFNKAGYNGELTLSENIADSVGLSFSYKAAFPGDKGEVADKKAFYTQYARAWCAVMRPSYEEYLRKVDYHALAWARVNEQMKHQTGFQEAFACKAGDKLYLPPEERLQVW